MRYVYFILAMAIVFVGCTAPNTGDLFGPPMHESNGAGGRPLGEMVGTGGGAGKDAGSMGGSDACAKCGEGGGGALSTSSMVASTTSSSTGTGGAGGSDGAASSSSSGDGGAPPLVITCDANCPMGYSLLTVENSPGACSTSTTCQEGAARVSVCVLLTLNTQGGCSPCQPQAGQKSLGELSPVCGCTNDVYYVCED